MIVYPQTYIMFKRLHGIEFFLFIFVMGFTKKHSIKDYTEKFIIFIICLSLLMFSYHKAVNHKVLIKYMNNSSG